ncbi:MAG TPA: hypothetical protein VF794_22500 [Archangium sp.]|uniref:hypothetical protein n=1 Tax=Archangium sp. TaxID=1872627 RepID=UPI002EDAEAFB
MALWVALLVGTAASAAPERVTYALILANNASTDPKQAPLRYADDDGARYYELFAPRTRETVLLSVLDAETQSLHPGLAARTRPPTRAALQEALGRLNARMDADRARGAEPVLYFVFTGHGKRGPAGEGAVSLLDAPFTRTDLYEKVIAPSRASLLHLIVDACDSYFFVNSRGALPVAPARFEAVKSLLATRELSRYPHVGAVLSTTREQESHEWSAIRSGVFSHQVRSALAGAADVNADGRVEYSELQAFVAAANQGVEDVRGRLDVSIQPPPLDRAAPLVDLGGEARLGFLLLPAGLEGRLWVEDARGVRVTEFHKARERSVVLGLPLGSGYYLRATGREAPFQLSRASVVVDAAGLPWRDNTFASRGAVEDAFRDRLFSVPFGPHFYTGYMASLGQMPVAPEQEPDLSP